MFESISVRGAGSAPASPSACSGVCEGSGAAVSGLLKSALSKALGPASHSRRRVEAVLGAHLAELTRAADAADLKRDGEALDAALHKLMDRLEAMQLERAERPEEPQAARVAKIQLMVQSMLDQLMVLLDTRPMVALEFAGRLKSFVTSALNQGGIGLEMVCQLKATLQGVTEFMHVLSRAFVAGHIRQVGMFSAEISPEAGEALNKALAKIPF